MTVEVESEPYYCLPINGTIATAWNSQPTSPTPRNVTNLKSPTQSNSTHRFPFPNKKNDEGRIMKTILKLINFFFDFIFLSSWKSNIFNFWWIVNIWLICGGTTTSK